VADECVEGATANRAASPLLYLCGDDAFGFSEIREQISGGMDTACYSEFEDKKRCFTEYF
jgi:hypothetical protein